MGLFINIRLPELWTTTSGEQAYQEQDNTDDEDNFRRARRGTRQTTKTQSGGN